MAKRYQLQSLYMTANFWSRVLGSSRREQAARCLLALAVINIGALIEFLLRAQLVAAAIRHRDQHRLPAHEVSRIIAGMVGGSSAGHVVFAALFVWLAVKVRGGRPWARWVATALVVLEMLDHLTIPILVSLLPSVAGEIIAVQAVALVFEIAALVLLWSPQSHETPGQPDGRRTSGMRAFRAARHDR
jgi:hypothetical protein